MPYFPMLERELAGRGIKKHDLAACAGISYKSLYNKMAGKAPFTWSEVPKIRNQFFPDMEYDVLLARADQDSA